MVDPARGHDPLLRARDYPTDVRELRRHEREHGDELHELAERDAPVDHVGAAKPDHETRGRRRHEEHPREERAREPREGDGAAAHLDRVGAEGRDLARLLGVRLHRPDSGDVLLHAVREDAELVLNTLIAPLEGGLEIHDKDGDDRQVRQRDEREPHVDRHEEGHPHRQHHDGAREVDEDGSGEVANPLEVVRAPRHQVAGALLHVELLVDVEQLLGHVVPQGVLDVACRAGDEEAGVVAQRPFDRGQEEDEAGVAGQGLPGGALGDRIDREPQDERRQLLRDGGSNEHEQARDVYPEVPPDMKNEVIGLCDPLRRHGHSRWRALRSFRSSELLMWPPVVPAVWWMMHQSS